MTEQLPLNELTAVSPIDGRYWSRTKVLLEHFSEFALIRARVLVECEYLIALANAGVVRAFSKEETEFLRFIPQISLDHAREVKEIEKTTNHDVKAVEYFIKKRLEGTSLADVSEWVHFALTSEDVNSVSQALCLRDALENVIIPTLASLKEGLRAIALSEANTVMLARTHGQPASPTTYGKEIAVFVARLERQLKQINQTAILVKWGGATGNWNAHVVALPDTDWVKLAFTFVQSLNTDHGIVLELNDVTTQIEPHDTFAELFDNMGRINTILLDLSEDLWRYISDDWVLQKPKAGEVGSSAMPHKVNPIDFENAEGNFGIANVLFEHFSRKLPVSRLQRDLSDSTVTRAFGTAFGHSLVGYLSLLSGFRKVSADRGAMLEAVVSRPEVLAEAIQTILRAEGVEAPYEQLKELTRGKQITLEALAAFADSLPVSDAIKQKIKALRPETYIGLAAHIATQ
ncbi:MAG TPA: adenylosuccinate lyase [Candidatus Paceibacterota bacterium]|nr:adenylosuccinate lyase [Candidatus Paceibacterota bacterium]